MAKSLKLIDSVANVISLSSRVSRIVIFLSTLIVLALIPIRWLESAPNLSICSYILGKYCYSVGITRGVSSLLKGDFMGAIDYNALAYPTLLVMICIVVYDLIYFVKLKK